MAEKLLSITTESVRTFVALWEMEIGWPQSVRDQLGKLGLDRLDIIHVLKNGDVVACEKESSDGAILVIQGVTCDDVTIRIVVWSDAGVPQIRLRKVTVI